MSKAAHNYSSCVHLSIIMFCMVCFTPSVWAQNDVPPKMFEMFVDGKEYKSITQYRRQQQRRLSLSGLENTDDPEKAKLIETYLNLTLEKFSDDDLKHFIQALRYRRKNLFDDISELDSELKQMQQMLEDYKTQQAPDLDLKLDVTKLKTIKITPKVRDQEEPEFKKTIIISRTNTQMAMPEEKLFSLNKSDVNQMVDEIAARGIGSLTFEDNKSLNVVGLNDDYLKEDIEWDPHSFLSVLLGMDVQNSDAALGTFQKADTQKILTSKSLPNIRSLTQEPTSESITGRELQNALSTFSQISQNAKADQKTDGKYAGLKLPKKDKMAGSVSSQDLLPLIMSSDEMQKLNNFLQYKPKLTSIVEKEDRSQETKQVNEIVSLDSEEKGLDKFYEPALNAKIKEFNQRQKQELKKEESFLNRPMDVVYYEPVSEFELAEIEQIVEVPPEEAVILASNEAVDVQVFNSQVYTPPIIIDRDNPKYAPKPQDIDINEVLNFKTLLNP